jgi:5-methylthioadenosine/S-adenosylhomocysteine deaminase
MKISTVHRFFFALISLVPACPQGMAQEEKYALKGTLVTPDQVYENGTILIAGGKIQAIGSDVAVPPGIRVVETRGIILPGLVDLHNHLTWNVLPRWKPAKEFANRYEWQQLPMYGILLSSPYKEMFKRKLGCDMNRYAEVKAISEGETSVVGSLAPPEKCIEGLARNLDFYSGLYQSSVLGVERLRYEVFPLELDVATAVQINTALDKKELTAFVVHLAEGKPTDASAAREFKIFAERGFLRPGVSIIHGVALNQSDFHVMAEKGVGLIWSPRSNLELYGATTDVVAALRQGVKIALSPDWSLTGSNGMLEELTVAVTWNSGQTPPVLANVDFIRMATEYPAELAGLGDKIGKLSPGYYADLLVLKKKAQDRYAAVVHSGPEDVELVMIGGEPVYGNPETMRDLLPDQQLDTLTVCGVTKAIYFGSEAKLQGTTPRPWKQTVDELNGALREWGSHLAPLSECGN